MHACYRTKKGSGNRFFKSYITIVETDMYTKAKHLKLYQSLQTF